MSPTSPVQGRRVSGVLTDGDGKRTIKGDKTRRFRTKWVPVRVKKTRKIKKAGSAAPWRSRQGVDVGIAKVARHDNNGDRERTDRVCYRGDEGARSLGARIGGQHQHGDVEVLLDDLENLLGRGAFSDHALRRDART